VLLAAAQESDPELHRLARELRTRFLGRRFGLCAIANAKSGQCREDCAFCAQSAHHAAAPPTFPLRDEAEILAEARAARDAGAARYSLVLSGSGPTREDLLRLVDMIRSVRELGLACDVSCGRIDHEQARALADAGCGLYHHNLETGPSFFPAVCTTHDYAEDLAALAAAREAGLGICAGGVFGLGESWEDRLELAETLAGLGVRSIPLNFLIPIPHTRLEHRPVMPADELLAVISLFRFVSPDAHLRVCAGRERILGPGREGLGAVLDSAASGVMAGNYLTQAGSDLAETRAFIEASGYEVCGCGET
jgi:biotin synthase